MSLRTSAPLLMMALFCSQPSWAIVPPEYDDPNVPWAADIELGFMYNRANTVTSSLNSRVRVEYDGDDSEHQLIFTTLHTEDNGNPTNEKYRLELQTDHDLNKKHYLFGRADLEHNRYGSLEQKQTYSGGYGYRFIDQSRHKLRAELGPGYRATKPHPDTTDQQATDEAIFRSALKYQRTLSQTLKFAADAAVESGEANTISTLKASVENKIIYDLSLVLEFEHRHTAIVPEGTANDETTTKLNLRYAIW